MQCNMNTKDAASKLNGLLKDEIAAVETYRQALGKVTNPEIRNELREVQQCHTKRVQKLTATIADMGEKPAQGAGPWGAFVKLMEGSARMFGDKAAIHVLEEEEDKGLSDYRDVLRDSDSAILPIVQELLPKQEGTHAKVSKLVHRVHHDQEQ